jgi:hypothetical protein
MLKHFTEKNLRGQNPPSPPPTWTENQLAEIDKALCILRKVFCEYQLDINLVAQFVDICYGFMDNSSGITELSGRVKHYRLLTQRAAKEEVWKRIRLNFAVLEVQLTFLRSSRLRIGAKVQ